MSISKVVELKHPITCTKDGKEEVLSSITLGRLKAKHLKLLPKDFFDNEEGKLSPQDIVPLVAALGNISEEVAGEIDLIDDLTPLAEAVGDFLSQSLETGKK